MTKSKTCELLGQSSSRFAVALRNRLRMAGVLLAPTFVACRRSLAKSLICAAYGKPGASARQYRARELRTLTTLRCCLFCRPLSPMAQLRAEAFSAGGIAWYPACVMWLECAAPFALRCDACREQRCAIVSRVWTRLREVHSGPREARWYVRRSVRGSRRLGMRGQYAWGVVLHIFCTLYSITLISQKS